MSSSFGLAPGAPVPRGDCSRQLSDPRQVTAECSEEILSIKSTPDTHGDVCTVEGDASLDQMNPYRVN